MPGCEGEGAGEVTAAAAAATPAGGLVALERFGAQHAELQELYLAECRQRRALHNELMDLKGAIRVFCRWAGISQSHLHVCTGCMPMAALNTETEQLFPFDITLCLQGAAAVRKGAGGGPEARLRVRPSEQQRGGGLQQASASLPRRA